MLLFQYINVINKNLDNSVVQNNVNYYTKVKNNIDLVDEESKDWPIFSDFTDYSLNDLWSSEIDSSLFSILNDFDLNNRGIKLMDVQLKI